MAEIYSMQILRQRTGKSFLKIYLFWLRRFESSRAIVSHTVRPDNCTYHVRILIQWQSTSMPASFSYERHLPSAPFSYERTNVRWQNHRRCTNWSATRGGVLKKVLYGEAPPRGPTPYLTLLYTIFSEKGPLSYTFYWKKAPLSYTFLGRLRNKSLKQEDFLSFFSSSA